MNQRKTSDNHAKAPICAAFVKEMREVFGDVRVLYVREGEFELGGKYVEEEKA
jgi:hypothetical protein